MTRSCGECSECCKGWVTGEIRGHQMYPGRPCFFLGNSGCSKYEERPAMCSSYVCAWVESEELPEWLKPNISKTLVTRRMIGEIETYDAAECGVKMDSSVLSWLIIWALNNKKNLVYRVDGGINRIGSPEFLALSLAT